MCLSQQKHIFVMTKDMFCHNKHEFVTTKMILVASPANDTGAMRKDVTGQEKQGQKHKQDRAEESGSRVRTTHARSQPLPLHSPLLKELNADLEEDDSTSDPLAKSLAKLASKCFSTKLAEDKLKINWKLGKYMWSSNCEGLMWVPSVNQEVWKAVPIAAGKSVLRMAHQSWEWLSGRKWLQKSRHCSHQVNPKGCSAYRVPARF